MTLADLTRRLASVLPTELVTNRADPPSGFAPLAPGPGSSRGPFAAMRHRNYRLFWIGQVLSLVGTWMQSVSEPWLVLLGGISIFGLNFQTLLPLFAVHTLGLKADGYGALYAVMGVGSLVGSMSLAFAGSRRPLVPLIIGGGLIFVTFELLLGATRSVAPAYVWVIFIGLSSMLMINTINVTVQAGVPDQLRGRVMSLYVLVFAGSSPIGGLFAGGVAQLWGAPAGFILGALFSLLFLSLAGWQLLRNVTMPTLRESHA